MSTLGIIGGTGFKDSKTFQITDTITSETSWGTPSSPLYRGTIGGKDTILLLRHGADRDIPPHRINHRANIYALNREADRIIGISSAGALHDNIAVPSISIPEDYVNLWCTETFYDEEIKHITPGLSTNIRKTLIEIATEKELDIDLRTEDTYVQTQGPRLETRAEVRFLSGYAELVGMTMASEATLSKEINVDYASIVSVDNYGHGIGQEKIRYEDIVKRAKTSWAAVLDIINAYAEGL